MLYPYVLPDQNQPDLMIVLDASHAEAFNRACRAAATAMRNLNQSESTFALLKTPQFYIAGSIDFSNNVVHGPAVEDFGNRNGLEDQKTFAELRNQLTGHIRTALNEVSAACRQPNLNLIFYAGGPLVILPPSPYRIAVLRFEDAKNVNDERQCVIANRASRLAHQLIWTMLEERIAKNRDPAPQPSPPETDVIDEPPEDDTNRTPGVHNKIASYPSQSQVSSFSDEEDEIDGMTDIETNGNDKEGDRALPEFDGVQF